MAKGQWVETYIEDRKVAYSKEAHCPVKMKNTPWLYCKYCGLLFLKNKATIWCVRMGCNYEYHNQYKAMMRRFSKQKV